MPSPRLLRSTLGLLFSDAHCLAWKSFFPKGFSNFHEKSCGTFPGVSIPPPNLSHVSFLLIFGHESSLASPIFPPHFRLPALLDLPWFSPAVRLQFCFQRPPSHFFGLQVGQTGLRPYGSWLSARACEAYRVLQATYWFEFLIYEVAHFPI